MATIVVEGSDCEAGILDLAAPIRSVIPGITGVVLQVLARTEQPLTGVRIAELTDGRASRAGVNKVLRALVASGVVGCQHVGAANLYVLNRRHIVAGAVVALSDLRTAAIKRIHELVESWAVQPDAVWLFGSAARGDGTVDSDVDLLVVRPVDLRADDTTWNEQTMGLNEHVLAWTGNRCDVLEYTAKELGVLARHNDPLVVEILHDAITIAGPAAREMIGR